MQDNEILLQNIIIKINNTIKIIVKIGLKIMKINGKNIIKNGKNHTSTTGCIAPAPDHLKGIIIDYASYGSVVEPHNAEIIDNEITLRVLQYGENNTSARWHGGEVYYTKNSNVKDIEGSNFIMV